MSTQEDGTLVPKCLDSPQTARFFPQFSSTQRSGFDAEKWTFKKLKRLGHSPEMPPDFQQPGCDMMVKNLCVEVKTAKLTYRRRKNAKGEWVYHPRWQWCIHPTHKGEFALILIAETPDQGRISFIVPGSLLGNRTHIQITSHPKTYSGWLKQYREKWSVIQFLLDEAYKGGGPLYEQWERAGERVAA